MRLGPFMVVLFIIYLILGLFNHILDPNLSNFTNTSSGATFLDILTQPYLWSTNTFLLLLTTAVFVAAAVTTGIGIISRSDILTLAGLAAVFFSMGAVPIVALYSFMARNIGQFAGCIPGDACAEASVVATLTAGVVALMWAMTVLEFWLWRPTTQ